MSKTPFLASALLVLFAGAAGAQQMYRWTDANGRVHYTDRPPQTAAKVEARTLTAGAAESSNVDFGTAQAMKNFPVTIFTAPSCQAPCAQGRDLLNKRGVPFREISVTDEKLREQLKTVSGDTQVPVLTVGRDVTKGFEAGMWTTALDAAGYPKSVVARRPAQQQQQTQAPQQQAQAGQPPGAKPEARGDAAPAEDPAAPPRPRGRYAPQ